MGWNVTQVAQSDAWLSRAVVTGRTLAQARALQKPALAVCTLSAAEDTVYRLVYVSTASVDLNETELEALLGPSRIKNETAGVTGLLIQVRDGDTGSAGYVQHLEGLHEAVDRTFQRIGRDELHSDVTVVSRGDETGRRFPDHPMRLVMVELADARRLAGGDPATTMPPTIEITTLPTGESSGGVAEFVRSEAVAQKLIAAYAEPAN